MLFTRDKNINWSIDDLSYFCDKLHLLPQNEVLQFALNNKIDINKIYNIKQDDNHSYTDIIYDEIFKELNNKGIYCYNIIGCLIKHNDIFERWAIITNNKREDMLIKNDKLYNFANLFFPRDMIIGELQNDIFIYKSMSDDGYIYRVQPFIMNTWQDVDIQIYEGELSYDENDIILMNIDNILQIVYTPLLSISLLSILSPKIINLLFSEFAECIDISLLNYNYIDKQHTTQVFTINDKESKILMRIHSLQALNDLRKR